MSTFTRPSIPHPHAPHPHQGRESIFDARVQREDLGASGTGYAHYARAAQECTEAIDRSVSPRLTAVMFRYGQLMGKCEWAVD
jgi:hypothetical protein